MDHFEGVDLGPGVDLDALVLDRLRGGAAEAGGRDAHGWLARAWERGKLSEPVGLRLAGAVHRVLVHPEPALRAEALALLLRCQTMAQPVALFDLVLHRFELFEALADADGRMLAPGLAGLVARVATGPQGTAFRRAACAQPRTGTEVLRVQCDLDPDWVAEHARMVAGLAVDPSGARIDVLVEGLRGRPDHLRRALEALSCEGPATVVRIRRAQGRWAALLHEAPAMLAIEYTTGEEHAPDDPFGQCSLAVHGDGRLTLVCRQAGDERAWEGRTDTATVRRLAAALASSTFPEVPPHEVPPGPTLARIAVRNAGRSVEVAIDHAFALEQAGWRDAVRLLDALNAAVSGGQVDEGWDLEALPVDGARQVK